MKHLRLFEEYKFFKIGDKSYSRSILVDPDKDNPYYTIKDSDKNIKDPDEPFFNIKKYDYIQKKNYDTNKRMKELNEPIILDQLEKIGLTKELLNRLNSIGYGKLTPMVSFNEKYSYYYISFYGKPGSIISITYFLPEKDYLFQTYNFNYKNGEVKKMFDNAEDGVNWIVNLYKNKDIEYRNSLRSE